MAEAFIYDHVRSPRGRGKKDGALHEVSTVQLAAGVLSAIRDRSELDTETVGDVMLGCVESMSRVGMGAAGNAWAMDPQVALPGYFVPQGISADLIATKYGFSRTAVDAYAVESQKRAANAWEQGYFAKSVVPVRDINGITILARY